MSIDKITSRHTAIMRRLVIDGATPNEVCQEFNLTPSRLSVIRKSEIWADKEAEMRREAFLIHKNNLDSLMMPAIEALGDCVESVDEGIKLRSAKEILDRTGLIAGVRIEGTKPVIKMYIPKGWNNKEGLTEEEGEEGANSSGAEEGF